MEKRKLTELFKVLLVIILFSILMTAFMFAYSTGNPEDIYNNILNSPIMILVNVFPIIFTTFLLYFIFGRLKLAIILNYVFYSVIFIINRMKIIYRSDTFKLSDFNLGVEALFMNTRGSYSIDRNSIFLFLIGLSFVIILISIFKFSKLKIRFRFVFLAILLGIGYFSFPKLYNNENIYYSIDIIGNMFNDVDKFNSKGLNYSVINNAYTNKVEPPESYDPDYYAEIDNKDTSEEIEKIKSQERPNIIWMMGEAFTEIPQNPIFTFTEENDPNKNFKEIQKDSVFFGNLVTHSFAGGTGDTEFDVLTGAMSMNYSPSLSYAFNSIRRDTKSLATIFDSIGYETTAFHPGFKWFYRRNTVYDRLGFGSKYFLEDIENPVNKGDYLSQEQFTDILLSQFKENVKNEEPVFQYAVDIQNHGPYFYDKYQDTMPFETEYPIEDKTREILGSYFIGLKDIDESVGRIYREIQEVDEPVIFIFYGDHLPGLGDGTEIYEEIGMEIGTDYFKNEMRFLSTPVIITGNEKGREFLNRENLELKNKQSISVNYLGSAVLDMLGYTDVDNFFSYLSDLRKEFRIISRNYFYRNEQPYPMDNVPSYIQRQYDEYLNYQHYRIREKQWNS